MAIQHGRKAAIVGGAACVLVTLVAWEWAEGRADVDYRTANARRGDIDVTVSATGNPNAVVTVQVGSQVSGNIQALFADFNTKVSKGQLIAQHRPRRLSEQRSIRRKQLSTPRARPLPTARRLSSRRARTFRPRTRRLPRRKPTSRRRKRWSRTRKRQGRSARRDARPERHAKEDLETAQTTYTSAVADRDALVAQKQAAEDSVKVARAQLNVANSLVAANQAQVKQFTGGAAIRADRPRSHEHHRARRRRRRVAKR